MSHINHLYLLVLLVLVVLLGYIRSKWDIGTERGSVGSCKYPSKGNTVPSGVSGTR